MGYPPRPARHTSFRQAENAGLAIDTSSMDAEFNDHCEAISRIVDWLINITGADNRLTNLSAATAQALAGAQQFTATAAQTVFLTSIVWQTAFSNLSVFVAVNGIILPTTRVAVANNGGVLQVTLTPVAPLTAGDIVIVQAFEPGAGVLTRLADTASISNGSYMVGHPDVSGLFSSTTVGGILDEIMVAVNAFIAAVGPTANLFLKDGSRAATGHFHLGGFPIKDLGDGSVATDAVTVGQVQTMMSGISTLLSQLLKLDGSRGMTGDLNLNTHKIIGVVDPVSAQDAATKNYVDTDATIVRTTGANAFTADQSMGGKRLTDLADPALVQDAATKAYADGLFRAAIGGSEIDGDFRNADTIPDPGYYDFKSFIRTLDLVLPVVTIIRVNGDLTLTDCNVTISDRGTPDNRNWIPALFDALIAQGGDAGYSGGGGSGMGYGGLYQPYMAYGRGLDEDQSHLHVTTKRKWARQKPILGGNGINGTYGTFWGGGGLVLLVNGDADFTDCIMDASAPQIGNVYAGFGGGGGGILIIATGKIKGGTFKADGARTFGVPYGAGGGGYVGLVASSFEGVQTISVAGGVSAGWPAYNGGIGSYEKETVSRDVLVSLLSRY